MLITDPNNDQNIDRVYTKMSEECSSQNNNANLPSCANNLKFLNNIDNCEDNQDDLSLSYDHLYASNTEDVDLNSTGTSCQSTESEVKFLKEWLLMHLDLIQQQNEEIANKDRTIFVLKQENEMLKERLKCLDRDANFQVNNLNNHISIKENKQEMTQDASHIEEDDKSSLLFLNQSAMINNCTEEPKYIINSSADLLHSNTQLCSVPESTSVNCDKTDLQIKIKKDLIVPQETSNLSPNNTNMSNETDENTFCKINSNYLVNTSVEETLKNLRMSIRRKRLCSGSSLLSNNESGNDESLSSRKKKKRKGSIKDDKILTSTDQYVTQSGEIASPVPLEADPVVELSSNNLEVPRWRVKVYTSCYAMEGTENLDDEVYNKRHMRLENDERRRKRWDVQRIREQRMVEKLKQRQEKVRSGGKVDYRSEPVQSLWPTLEDVKYLEVNEQLPVSAFGAPIPRFTPSEFTLPWLNNPHALLKKTSNRKSTIRRKATKR